MMEPRYLDDMAMLTLPTCTIDLAAGEVVRPAQVIALTPKEADLLRYLAEHAGTFCSRATLLEAVWGYRSGTRTHTLATNVYTLRQKIEPDPSSPTVLVGRRGRGYCLVLPEPASSTPDAGDGTYVPRPELRLVLQRAWNDGACRIALVGPAGVGKSRFVDEHREAWRPGFAGGIERVQAGEVRTADGIRALVLRALAATVEVASAWP
ncbi:MAG: winged helix-turn-helix domain-containing protein, partial [Myxococcota bacterium]